MSRPLPPFPAIDDKPVVATFRAPLFNPSETFIQAQLGALQRYRPLIVGLEDKGNAHSELRDRLLLAGSRSERAAFRLFGRCGAMAERVRPFAPLLVHAHFGTDGLAALPLARTLGVPLVTTLHGHEISRSRARMLMSGRPAWTRYALFQRRLMRGGHLFLAVSDAVRRRALALGYPEDRTITHYIGADIGRYRPGYAAEPGLVLHVGRLVEKKGTADLIEAFAQARVPGSRLVIIGSGPLRKRLKRRAAALSVNASITFLGELPPDEVAAWMRRAWLIAAPSVTARDGDSEGLPMVLVEAAASGLPAVATDHAGISEVVAEGRTGFLVSERDTRALAGRLGELLRSTGLRTRMGESARALAEERFDLARQTALLEDHYDRLVRVPR